MRLLGQKIILRQMSVLCQIGIHAHELNKPQRVMVDVTLGLAASVRAEVAKLAAEPVASRRADESL